MRDAAFVILLVAWLLSTILVEYRGRQVAAVRTELAAARDSLYRVEKYENFDYYKDTDPRPNVLTFRVPDIAPGESIGVSIGVNK